MPLPNPTSNILLTQKQGRIFQDKLSNELNSKNKLYKMKDVIDWKSLEKNILNIIDIKRLGRNKTEVRIMLGLAMLQAMYNFSDCLTSETFEENICWQYFCGYEYTEQNIGISESTIIRFRNSLGEEGYNIILKELVNVGCKVGSYKKRFGLCDC